MDSTARNEVLLVGRLAAEPQDRELPSGDRLTALRLVVDRPDRPERAGVRRGAGVDTIDCVVRGGAALRAAPTWGAGDVLELQGALRRRFFRTPSGVASRYEVEVVRGRRLVKAAS